MPGTDPTLAAARLRRASARLARVCTALLVALPLALACYWAFEDAERLASRYVDASTLTAPIAAWQRLAGAALSAIPALLAALALIEARRCFRDLAAGRIFATAPIRALRRFAGFSAVAAAATIPASSAISVLLTLGNAPGSRQLTIGVSSDEVFALLFAAIVWTLAAVLEQGRALADENASFV